MTTRPLSDAPQEDPRPEVALTGDAEELWDRALEEFATGGAHELWRRHSDAVNRALLDEWLPTGTVESVLKTDLFDEATSEGILPFLRGRTEHVVGIDTSATVLALAKGRSAGLRAVRADVRLPPFAEGAFDRIVSLSTLDHFETLEEIAAALRELSRILRPGGELVLTLDNLANPVVWLRNALPIRLLHKLGLVPYYVGRSCGPRRLASLVGEAGLDVVETQAIMHAPRVLAVAAARHLGTRASAARQERFLERLGRFERWRGWPSRFLTGYFIAIRAVKPDGSSMSGGPTDS